MANWLHRDLTEKLDKSIRREVRGSVLLQFVTVFPAALILDGGFLFQICFLAAAGWWLGVLIIFFRRRNISTKANLVFLRFGYAALLPLTALSSPGWDWLIN